MTPLASTDPNDIAIAAKCFCSITERQYGERTYLLNQVAAIATPPCVTPTTPTLKSVSPSPADPNTSLRVSWKQTSNVGSLIIGWIIYWGITSGVYPNQSPVQGAASGGVYDIPGLTPGTTYYVVVKAISSISGCVSGLSTEKSATTSGSPPICVAGMTLASAWAARVVANGGPAPTTDQQNAIATFQCGLVDDGLDTQLVAWTALLGSVGVVGRLIQARTPQKPGPASSLWGVPVGGFDDTDVVTNGVNGDAANSQYMTTGFTPSTGFASPISCGWCAYVDTVTQTGFIGGAYNNGTPAFLQAAKHSDGKSYSYIGAIGNVVSVASPGAGFYSGQRVSGTDHRLYFASSGSPHAQIGATDVAPFAGPLPNQPEDAWGINNYGSSAHQLFTTDTIGFWARTTGLLAADSANLYNRLVALFTALGRTIR